MELSCGRPAAALPGMEAESPGEDYESLPTSASLSTHMTAGAVAGILEHTVMYPVDSVKTRMQSLQPDPKAQYKSVYQALKKIIHTEGFWRPLRGINVTMLGAGPAHAMYFACYEKMKRTLSDIIHHGGNSHLANGIAGSMATLLHDAVMNPAEGVPRSGFYIRTLWCKVLYTQTVSLAFPGMGRNENAAHFCCAFHLSILNGLASINYSEPLIEEHRLGQTRLPSIPVTRSGQMFQRKVNPALP